MPRRRLCRRGKVGTASTTAPALGSLLVSMNAVALTATAGAASTEYSSDTVTIRNGGPGSLSGPQVTITYGSGSGWLSIAMTSDNAGTITLTPTIDASALAAATYTATATIADSKASNTGQTITFTLVVSAAAAIIGVSPPALSFSIVDETASGTAQAITISNIGAATLAVPTVGVITGTGASYIASAVVAGASPGPYTLTVTPTATGGTVGSYSASIPIVCTGATNTPYSYPVSITVTSANSAFIALDRSLDDVTGTVGGGNPSSPIVGVRSTTTLPLAGPVAGTVTYAGSHTGWATPTVGATSLSVAIDMSGISTAGTTFASIPLTDANASNTATYQVYLKVDTAVSPAALSVAPTSIGRSVITGNALANTTLAVTNNGAGGLTGLGTITASFLVAVAWANVTYANGVVTIGFDTASLAAGTYNTTIRVAATSATNSPVDIGVQIIVAAAASTYTAPAYTLPTHITFASATDVLDGDAYAAPAIGGFA